MAIEYIQHQMEYYTARTWSTELLLWKYVHYRKAQGRRVCKICEVNDMPFRREFEKVLASGVRGFKFSFSSTINSYSNFQCSQLVQRSVGQFIA
jgi:hypothetical protein